MSPGAPGLLAQDFFVRLERSLASLSHSEEGAKTIEIAVSQSYRKAAAWQLLFATPGAICIAPIPYEAALACKKWPLEWGDITRDLAGFWIIWSRWRSPSTAKVTIFAGRRPEWQVRSFRLVVSRFHLPCVPVQFSSCHAQKKAEACHGTFIEAVSRF